MTETSAPEGTASHRGRNLRICVVGLRGIPGVMGGVEAHCEQLLPRVKRLMPASDILVVGRRPYLDGSQFEFDGIKVVPLPALRNQYLETISNTILAVGYARFVARAEVLHIHNIGPGLLAPLAHVLGMKVVVTYHSKNFEHAKWNSFAKAVLRFGEWCAVKAAQRVIVVSSSMTKELRRRYPHYIDKFVFIPNGTTIFPARGSRDEEQSILQQFGLTERQYILAVGRLVPEKSFHTLIEAYESANPACKLVIAGKADHEDDYSRALARAASAKICFTGILGQRDLAALYRNASLFVLPSTHEGLPIAALEAASLGLPVLLSDIQPNLDIGLRMECYFPVGDVDALRALLLQPHDRYVVDSQAVIRQFDWTNAARQTAEVYQELRPAAQNARNWAGIA